MLNQRVGQKNTTGDFYGTGVEVATFCGHRRCGKSEGFGRYSQYAVNDILNEKTIYKIRGDVDSYDPSIAFIAETQKQAKQVIWKLLKRWLAFYPSVRFNNTSLQVTIPRPLTGDEVEIQLLSARDHNKIRGSKRRLVLLDECQRVSEDAIKESIMATLQDSRGKLMQAGTATSLGHFATGIKNSIENHLPVYILPVTDTSVFPANEWKDMIRKYGVFAFRQEYMCDFSVSSKGAFYEEYLTSLEAKGNFKTAIFDPQLTTILSIDEGVGNGFAGWISQVRADGREIRLLDYYQGYTLLSELKEDMQQNGISPDLIVLPFDVKKRRMEAYAPRSSLDVWREVFPECHITTAAKTTQKFLDIADVVSNLHLLRFPAKRDLEGNYIESEAFYGLRMLKEYRRGVDAMGEVTDTIEKSPANHCADALRYLYTFLKVREGIVTNIVNYKSNASDPLVITERNVRTSLLRNTGILTTNSIMRGI